MPDTAAEPAMSSRPLAPPDQEIVTTVSSPPASVSAGLPAPRRDGFHFTHAVWFNAAGWLVLALLAWFVVIPAVRNGNWEPFKVASTWVFLWEGLKTTLYVGAFSVVISTAIGFVLALGRLSNNALISNLSAGYIELMRALPSYLIIFYVFIVFPKLGINLSPRWFAITGLTLYTSAVMAEIFRAGILSIEKGQLEAAYSLGLQSHHTIQFIILPQALRRMAPAIVSQLITLTKDTSLAAIIALQELTRAGKQLYEYYSGEPGSRPVVLETLGVVAAIYFVICYALALISQRLEMNRGR